MTLNVCHLMRSFTIAPHDPDVDIDGFKRYAARMNGLTEGEFYTILTGKSFSLPHLIIKAHRA